MKKTLLVAFFCGFVLSSFSQTKTIDLHASSSAPTYPSDCPAGGTLSFTKWQYDSSNGLKLSSDNYGVTWTVNTAIITAVTFNGWINTNNTSKNWGYKFTTDNGQSWGTEFLLANSGIKSENTFTIPASNIPANCNGIQIYRKAGTSSYIGSITITLGSAGPSDDATLKALTYDGTSVPNFSASTLSYDVELPATYSGKPTVDATVNHNKATKSITQPSAVPGSASVLVTAEDGTTNTYTITFTKESSAPKAESATWTNITAAGATVDNVGMNITGKVKYGTGLTSISPSFTGKNIQSWTPNTAQNFSNGAVDYTLTSATGETTVYHVTITEADPISDDATLKSLTVAGCTLSPAFSPTVTSYQVEVAGANVPKTTATANHAAANAVVTDATSVAGVTKVIVTAEDGVTTKEYQITFKTVVPPSGLTIHMPDIYDQPKEDGGYSTPLVVFNNREYEVYYAGRDASSALTITTTPAIKKDGICSVRSKTGCKAEDGWVEVSEPLSSPSTYTVPAQDEFASGNSAIHKIQGGYYKLHIKGFDQFSIYAMDNNADKSKGKYIEVYVDNILQNMTLSTTASVRRFDISSDEHLIEVKGLGESNDQVIAFSLRCGTDPRIRYVMGNDSSQQVFQTKKLSPVTYFVKNNVDTRVEWVGNNVATGIDLVKHGSEGVGDTLQLEGDAKCPVGTYEYYIVSYNASGVEKARSEKGSFSVKTQISAKTDTVVEGYEGWSMDAIEFSYLALDASGIHLTWTGATPAGVSGSGADGVYSITGTPTAQGVYPFTISIDGGNKLSGKLTVKQLNLGTNPLLYVYKSDYQSDGIHAFLESKGYSMMLSKQTALGQMLQNQQQISKFKVIILSENVDANHPDVMSVIKQSSIPVLNMQAFAYTPSRLDWGNTANGSAVTGKMKIIQPTHPIFRAMGLNANQEIELLDSVETRGLVASEVYHSGSWCLSTTAVRGEDYRSDGEQQTFMHEVSAQERGSKYLCLPIAKASSNHLTTNGKNLIVECIKYLMDGSKSPIALPTLQITSFSINGVQGVIDQASKIITVTINQMGDYSAVTPVITVADPTTFVIPASGETIDMSDPYLAHDYTVCDYINKETYKVYLKHPTDLDEIYMPGEWVNIFDMRGNKVTTTNENVHEMHLPRGIYIIQSATHSFRIFR